MVDFDQEKPDQHKRAEGIEGGAAAAAAYGTPGLFLAGTFGDMAAATIADDEADMEVDAENDIADVGDTTPAKDEGDHGLWPFHRHHK